MRPLDQERMEISALRTVARCATVRQFGHPTVLFSNGALQAFGDPCVFGRGQYIPRAFSARRVVLS